MPERDRPSIEALATAAGLDWSEPLQIAGPQYLRSLDPTSAVLMPLGDATLPPDALAKYPDEAPLNVVDADLRASPSTAGTIRLEGLPAGTLALGIAALSAAEVRFDPVGLRGVIQALRDPESGCPWDLEQDHQTLRPHLLEETYEVLQALDSGDPALLAEELGDLYMQIVLHSEIASQSGEFDLDDVAEGIRTKLVRRHPHVFGEVEAETAEEVTANWDKIKADERQPDASALDGVPRALPSLQRAQSLAGRAQRRGFFWPTDDDLLANLSEELREIATAENDDQRRAEFGDLLFALSDFARRQEVPLEDALRQAAEKFERRYRAVEQQLREDGQSMEGIDRAEQMRRWEAVKSLEGESG